MSSDYTDDEDLHGVGGVGVLGGAVLGVHLHRAVRRNVVPVFRGVVPPLVPDPVVQRFPLLIAQLGRGGRTRGLLRIRGFLRFRALCRSKQDSSTGRKADAQRQQKAQNSHCFSPFHLVFSFPVLICKVFSRQWSSREKRPMSASQGCRTWALLFKKRKSI